MGSRLRQADNPGHRCTVYPAGHPAALLVLALAPDLLAGWTRVPEPAALPLLPPVTYGLSRLPRLPAASLDASVRAVRSSGAGLIVDVGGSTVPELADIAQETGAELLTLDGRLSGTPDSLRRLGRALDRRRRGEMLAEEVARWLDMTARSGGPAIRIHYGCGPDALEVPAVGALAREIFPHLGLDALTAPSSRPLVRVTLQQVAAFDPDWIICLDEEAARSVRAASRWGQVRAAAEGRVLASPSLPFLWLDRPPGINRVLGLLWLAGQLGPVRPGEPEIGRCLQLLCGREG